MLLKWITRIFALTVVQSMAGAEKTDPSFGGVDAASLSSLTHANPATRRVATRSGEVQTYGPYPSPWPNPSPSPANPPPPPPPSTTYRKFCKLHCDLVKLANQWTIDNPTKDIQVHKSSNKYYIKTSDGTILFKIAKGASESKPHCVTPYGGNLDTKLGSSLADELAEQLSDTLGQNICRTTDDSYGLDSSVAKCTYSCS